MRFLNRNLEKKCWVNYIVSDRRSANENMAIACRGKKDRTNAAPLSVEIDQAISFSAWESALSSTVSSLRCPHAV
jgi:hypothetical protein